VAEVPRLNELRSPIWVGWAWSDGGTGANCSVWVGLACCTLSELGRTNAASSTANAAARSGGYLRPAADGDDAIAQLQP